MERPHEVTPLVLDVNTNVLFNFAVLFWCWGSMHTNTDFKYLEIIVIC